MIQVKAQPIREVDDQLMAKEMEEALGKNADEAIAQGLESSTDLYKTRSIVPGIIVDDHGDEIVVDIGYKSEGHVSRDEFKEEEIEIGVHRSSHDR